jgi:hypothetical protein
MGRAKRKKPMTKTPEEMTTWIFLALMSVHFLADFVLQSDWMAQGKSKHIWPLTVHVAIYSACFAIFDWRLAVITFWAHWLTDAITSRINIRLWAAKKVHWFFVSVGFDQLLHAWQLVLTYQYVLYLRGK